MNKLKIILISGIFICTMLLTSDVVFVPDDKKEIATAIVQVEIKKYESYKNPEIYKKLTREYYDVPLTKEIQDLIFEECEKYNLSIELVLAIIDVESNYQSEVISKTNDYGLMQININNHKWLNKQLGIYDFLDQKQNITAGIYMLSIIASEYTDERQSLMVYNSGEFGASKLWEQGIYETRYTEKVIDKKNELKGSRLEENVDKPIE